MKLSELSQKIGFSVIVTPQGNGVEINRFFAGESISELLSQSCKKTLLVSAAINLHLLKVAKIIDVPAICLVDPAGPDGDLVREAASNGTALIVSSLGMGETIKCLYGCMGIEARVVHEYGDISD